MKVKAVAIAVLVLSVALSGCGGKQGSFSIPVQSIDEAGEVVSNTVTVSGTESTAKWVSLMSSWSTYYQVQATQNQQPIVKVTPGMETYDNGVGGVDRFFFNTVEVYQPVKLQPPPQRVPDYNGWREGKEMLLGLAKYTFLGHTVSEAGNFLTSLATTPRYSFGSDAFVSNSFDTAGGNFQSSGSVYKDNLYGSASNQECMIGDCSCESVIAGACMP